MGTPMCKLRGTPRGSSRGIPKGTPESKMRDAHQDQSTIHPEVPSKKRVAHQDQADVYSGLQTKASLEYQDKTAILSVWTKVKFEEVFPDETETWEIVQVPVNPIPNNMSNESKLLPDLGHNICYQCV